MSNSNVFSFHSYFICEYFSQCMSLKDKGFSKQNKTIEPQNY